MNILLIGSGGREHALYWKMKQSSNHTIYCAPGNGGTENNIELDITNHSAVIEWCRVKDIELVVIGPEQPLVDGLADSLRVVDFAVFGCSKAAAQLEGSKSFMKEIATAANVPTARFTLCNDAEEAKHCLADFGLPVVIKADGLAAGKGVVIAENQQDAIKAIDALITLNGELVIEEWMQGPEISFFALSDGRTVVPFATAQDHKRAFDNDKGPNTGGMGAFSPARPGDIDENFEQTVMQTIILPTLEKLGVPYVGVLYAGLMMVDGIPKLIEYNVRFGDPECQAMLLRLENDLVDALYAVATENLDKVQLTFSDTIAINVVMATQGYPGSYKKGSEIKGVATLNTPVFHAGTKRDGDKLIANGGRVLNVVGQGETLEVARKQAYEAIQKIDWPEGFYRKDIGL